MTLPEAFELRKKLLSSHGKWSPEIGVLVNILCGEYDKYKEEGLSIAQDDLRFIEEYNKS